MGNLKKEKKMAKNLPGELDDELIGFEEEDESARQRAVVDAGDIPRLWLNSPAWGSARELTGRRRRRRWRSPCHSSST